MQIHPLSSIAASTGAEAEPAGRNAAQRLRLPLMVGLPILIALVGGTAYWRDAPYVSTDDASVLATRGSINARVAGQVVEIAVRDNQFVHKGQLLFRVDPVPYEVAVEQAQAHLASVRMQVAGLKATYRQQLAQVQSARAAADFSQAEFTRKTALLASDFTSRSDYDRSDSDLKVARQTIAATQQQVFGTVAALDGNPGIAANAHPAVQEARALLDKARLDLSYTRVTAPEDGIVARVDTLQLGDYVQGGTPVLAMMSTRRLWVEANFRETDLTAMRPGQPATIAVDAYPGYRFKAHVVSMSPGTGAQFSLLPPENATGNWVKVVQRVPVRLEFDTLDPRRPLYSGISVTARVDTRHAEPGQ